jgi:ubiquinone biosynthesis protein
MPPQQRTNIQRAQLALPVDATMAHRAVTLLRQCPTLHKLGQVVARDRRLPWDLRKRLQELESGSPDAATVSEALAVVRAELGDRAEIKLRTQALAEGSVAVVIPFLWRPKRSKGSRRGVFKVLKTGVDETLAHELDVWSELGEYLDRRCAHYQIPRLDYRATFDNVRELLLSEVHLGQEQANLIRARRFYTGDPSVLVPELLPFCTPRLTAMERVDGDKVTFGGSSPEFGRERALKIAETLVARPFWSTESVPPVHGDPHAGNLFWTRDGRLALLDWSMTTSLEKSVRVQLVQVLIGAMTLDEPRICEALQVLAGTNPDETALRAVVSAAVGELRGGRFPGFEWTLRLLDQARFSARIALNEDLTVFRKALHSLDGVLNDLVPTGGSGPVFDMALLRTGAGRFFSEFAHRPGAPFFTRKFGSHVSNADLVALWMIAPQVWAGACWGWWSKNFTEVFQARPPNIHDCGTVKRNRSCDFVNSE